MRLARIALCLLILLAFHDAAAATDQTLRLAPGAQATIALKEDPSTGYKWQIAPAESSNLAIVRNTDRGFARNGSAGKPRIGAPGMHRWSVVARAAPILCPCTAGCGSRSQSAAMRSASR